MCWVLGGKMYIRQGVYIVMVPNKIHSKHLSKCYYIFSILSTSINLIKKWPQFWRFLVYWEVICLKIPADVLLWFIWKAAHPARNAHRKTPTSSKILLSTVAEAIPEHQLLQCALGCECSLAGTTGRLQDIPSGERNVLNSARTFKWQSLEWNIPLTSWKCNM